MLERETDSAAHGGARHRSSAKEDRERLIQLGKITPFAAGGFERRLHQSRESAPEPSAPRPGVLGRASGDSTEEEAEEEMEPPSMHVEKRRLRRNDRGERLVDDDDGEEDYSDGSQSDDDDDDDEEAESESDRGQGSDAEDILDFTSKRRRKRLKAKKSSDLRYVDDGNEMAYEERLEEWAKRRRRRRLRNEGSTPVENENGNLDTELHMPSPYAEDAHFDKGYRCPGEIWSELFEYQRTGVKWLWELHDQDVGGIIGDEMGLGKTVVRVNAPSARKPCLISSQLNSKLLLSWRA